MPVNFGGPGVAPNLGSLVTNVVELQAGQVWAIPSGRWALKPGPYTSCQELDPVAGFWRTIGAGGAAAPLEAFFSDGVNYRLANQSGCAIGAQVNTGGAGSGYTSAPIVTPSAGNSVWRAIVGGAVSTTVTVTNGGLNYTYPPTVLFSVPPAGGIQATGYCTLSGGAVTSVTITDQGAGYPSPPTITFVNDPREVTPVAGSTATLGYNASAIATLTGAGTITGIICLDHGSPVTGTTLPTLSFTGGGGSGAAATVIMCWSITAYNVSATTAGAAYAAPVIISAYGGYTATAAAYTNVATQSKILKGRNAFIVGAVAGGAITATGQVVNDGGIYPGIPTVYVASAGVGATTQAVFLNPTMGGVTDFTVINPT